MPEHQMHSGHTHQHGPNCGHAGIKHGDHVDYLHDGHLHHTHEGHIDDCRLEATGQNADKCTPQHSCTDHDKGHKHSASCGHQAIPHAGHIDYLVGQHLHHPHDSHCDDHGPIQRA